MSNLDRRTIDSKIRGISHDTSIIPVYCDAATKEKHGHNLVRLFDYNFGKDWACFLNLFYWDKFGKHHIVFKNPHKDEDNQKFYLLRRKAYYCLAKKIMEYYFQNGFDDTKAQIYEDLFRLKWSDTPNNKESLVVWVSSKLYDKIHPE